MSALPAVFLPYQQALMAAAAAYPVVVVEKSRRTGYSWAAAAIAALKASSARSAGGSDVLYMSHTLDITREFIDYVAKWAKLIEPAAAAVQEFLFADPEHPERDIKAFRIKFASGFEVIALPSVPRALRGHQGMVIIDEAAFHENLEEVLTAAYALLMWGGSVLIISTHKGDLNPFNVLVQDIRVGNEPHHLLRCTFDDAIADGLYRYICLATHKAWSPEAEAEWRASMLASYGSRAQEELFCIPSQSTGSAIPGPLIEARMVDGSPVLRWECSDGFVHWAAHLREAEALAWCEENLLQVLKTLNPDEPHVFGSDFGRKGDLSVTWPFAIRKNMVRHTPFIVELRNVPFEQQRQILFYLCDRLPRFRAGKMDATGNGAFLGEVAMQRYGELRIEPVMLNEPWYRDNMPAFKAAFEDAMLDLPRDRDIMSDIRVLAYVRGIIRVPTRTVDGQGKQRHGDAAIAGALAYAASRADPEEYDYKPGRMRQSGFGFGAPVTTNRWRDRPDPDEDVPRGSAGARGMFPDMRPL